MTELRTPYEKDLRRNKLPWNEYPRPSLKRAAWFNLNGAWRLAVSRGTKEVFCGKCTVPFPPESRLSGASFAPRSGDVLCYERKFTPPRAYKGQRVLLHFGAVDGPATVLLNGERVGEIPLPYLPASFEITHLLQEGENILTVTVWNKGDTSLPWGKQRKKRGGMWYTPVSGIWQTVWMEAVPQNYIERIRCETEANRVTFRFQGGGAQKTLILQKAGEALEYRFEGDSFTLTLPEPRFWCPEDPFLYRFTVLAGEDRVESYFAFRTMETKEVGGQSVLCLNGRPTFFHGLLDQGYFPDGIFLPASPRGFEEDVLRCRALGFNMLRKHIKLEPELFYYYCDLHGVAVLQDMINAGPYSFLLDTVLPTLGLKRGVRHRVKKATREAFFAVAEGIQEALFHHPSVVCYTIFNEGWGQFDGDGAYRRLKAKDPSRLYDTTSGWFFEKESDVESHHVYFKPVRLPHRADRPTVLSEFGGYSLKLAEHSFNPKRTYGYRFFEKAEDFRRALETLYREEILPEIGRSGLCCTVLTQLSDVEDETNGLLTYDRKAVKVEEKAMQALAEELQAAFTEKFPSAGLEK
ncbi:MAG: glycoside hydrolase family 2 [Clostridia bacterium]|nr:glycoside hydrolase family 2 [Clostridia bacterium]